MQPLPTLKQCLIDTELARLRVIARLWGLELHSTRPLDIADELARALADRGNAADAWWSLPDDERAALAGLLNAGGRMPVAAFKRRFGEIRPMGPGRLEREAPWRDPASATEGLWYRGLIYVGFDGEGNETFPVVFVPGELQAALPVVPESEPPTLQLQPVVSPPHVDADSDSLLDDITTLLAFIHNQVVTVRNRSTHEWPPRSARELARQLHDANAERLAFMLHLLDQLGWTRLSKEHRLRLVPEPVTAWLREPDMQTLIDAWCQMHGWDELRQLPTLQPDETGTWHNDPTLARAALLRHLSELPPGEWIAVDDFVGAVKGSDPDFQRPGGDYEAWYVRDRVSGAYLKGFESWERVEGVLLRALLSGPARWLGLVELGAAAQGAPPAVFRTPVSDPLGSVPEPPPPAIQPDLTVKIPAARRFQRFQLARFADLVRVGDPYLYRLAPVSLQRAASQRIDVEKVLSFLDDLSDAPLPETVRSTLSRWGQRGTEVWLERTLLLHVADEGVMEQLTATPKTARYLTPLNATAALVNEKDWPRLVAALAELGLLPELVNVAEA